MEHLDSPSQPGLASTSEEDAKISITEGKDGLAGWPDKLPPSLSNEPYVHDSEWSKQPERFFRPERPLSETLEDIYGEQPVVLTFNIPLPKSKPGVFPAADVLLHDRTNSLHDAENMQVIVHPTESNAARRKPLSHGGESCSWFCGANEDINSRDGSESDKSLREEMESLAIVQKGDNLSPGGHRQVLAAVVDNILGGKLNLETRLHELAVKSNGRTADKLAGAIELENWAQKHASGDYPPVLAAKIEVQGDNAEGTVVSTDAPPTPPAMEGAVAITDLPKGVDGKTLVVGAGAVALAALAAIWLVNKFKGQRIRKSEKTYGRRHARNWEVEAA